MLRELSYRGISPELNSTTTEILRCAQNNRRQRRKFRYLTFGHLCLVFVWNSEFGTRDLMCGLCNLTYCVKDSRNIVLIYYSFEGVGGR